MSPAAGKPSGRIVAELGRPETPEETAAREAERSRTYRAAKTFPNLVWALIFSLIAMLAIVLVVPRSNQPIERNVNVAELAQQSQVITDVPLIAPSVPAEWKANAAEARQGADGVLEWSAGYIVPGPNGEAAEFVGFSEGIQANPTWTLERTGQRQPTGEIDHAGLHWQEYDYTDLPEKEAGNSRYALSTERDGTTFVVYGSHSPERVKELASAVADALKAPAK